MSNEWQPIATAPQHGNYVRVFMEEGVLYCPDGGIATHWLRLPAPPMDENDDSIDPQNVG